MYIDSSDYQLGACIMQQHNIKWRPVAYYSRKLTGPRKNFSVLENEPLSIVITFKELCSMLSRDHSTGFTDHQNPSFRSLSSKSVEIKAIIKRI